MKKVILSLTILLAVISLAACSLNSQTSIKFTQLPDAIYEQKNYTEDQVKNLLEAIVVEVKTQSTTKEFNLKAPELEVSGFDTLTLSNPGSYTLTVTYESLSISYNYTVVAVAEPVEISTVDDLIVAGKNGGIYQLKNDIEFETYYADESLSIAHSGLIIKKDFTLYGNGHKIFCNKYTSSSSNKLVNIKGDNLNVNLFDVTLESGINCTSRCLQIQESKGVNLVLDNVTMYSNPNGYKNANYCIYMFNKNENHSIKITNCKLVGWAAISTYSNNTVFEVENSVLQGENYQTGTQYTDYGLLVVDGGKFHIDHNTYGDLIVEGEQGVGNTFNLNNCQLICIEKGDGVQYLTSLQYNALLNVVNITNCEITQASELYRVQGIGNKLYIDGNLQK